MRAVLQRVTQAQVESRGKVLGQIGAGLVVFLGVAQGDTERDLDWVIEKITHLRIFRDREDKMNNSLLDVNGSLLLISQFTLLADVQKGRRPSFLYAAEPDLGEYMYDLAIERCRAAGLYVATGKFGADMQVRLINDGPVTIQLDSKRDATSPGKKS